MGAPLPQRDSWGQEWPPPISRSLERGSLPPQAPSELALSGAAPGGLSRQQEEAGSPGAAPGGREGAACQRAGAQRTTGAKKQAMGTQGPMHYQVRLGLEDIGWGWCAGKDGAMAPSFLCSLTLSPICLSLLLLPSVHPPYLTQWLVLPSLPSLPGYQEMCGPGSAWRPLGQGHA